MKYSQSNFNQDVSHYKKLLSAKDIGDDLFVIFDLSDAKAFFSIAPLSLAAHQLKKEMAVFDSKKSMIDVLREFWKIRRETEAGMETERVKSFLAFLLITNQLTKNEFGKLISPPKTILIAKKGKWNILSTGEFLDNKDGRSFSKARCSWFKKYKWPLLMKTADVLWNQLYNIKRNETVSCGFDLLQTKEIMTKPLEDYLDSYLIAYAMATSAAKQCKSVTMGTSSAKKELMAFPEKISDLSATITGCELEKDIDEPVFAAFKKLSKHIGANKLKPADAVFSIKGEGYGGKHIFGQSIGYPTKNKKSKWQTPSQILYKLPWWPQTKDEPRKPYTRLAVTDTIPLDIFIETSNIDWFELEARNRKIMGIIDKSDSIRVIGEKAKHGQSDFTVFIKDKKGKRRTPFSSGIDVRSKIDKDHLKETGIYAGTYANIPGGEAFMTPEYIKGTFIGDVVIATDSGSHMIPKIAPLVIKCDKNGYEILSGDRKIVKTIINERNESLKQLNMMQKSGAVPKDVAELKKKNFMKLGEFAINTNPKARLCEYLMVNEKIANMIHIALGMGFDADRSSTYHYDIVINAKSQKFDIYGQKDGKKLWILKKGHFAV